MNWTREPMAFWWRVIFSLLVMSLLPTANTEGAPKYNSTNTLESNEFFDSLSLQEQTWLRTHPVIRVVQDPGWPPIEFTNDKGEPSGMSAEYLDLIEQRIGVKFERVQKLKWAEAYPRLKSWDIDMTTSVAVTPQRSLFWAFTKPYLNIPIVIATQSEVTYIADIRELAGKNVAVVEGYAVEDWVKTDFPNIKLVRAKTTLEGLQMVQRGEVFAYLDNLLIIGDYQAKMKVTNIKIAGQTPYVNAQCMAVRKDWAPLAEILQKALESISEAERNNIYRKWLPVRYEHGFDYALFWKVLAVFIFILLAMIFWNLKLAREISSRKKAEDSLRESEERHRRYILGSPYGVFVTDEKGRYLQVNPSGCRITGYSEIELCSMAVPDLFYEEHRADGLQHFQKVVQEGKAQGEMIFRKKNGEKRWWSVTAVRISDSQFLGFCNDITDRKQAEEKSTETLTLLNSVLEGTTDAIFVKDKTGRYLLVNSGTCKAIGRDAKDIIGKNDRELFPPESAGVINNVDQQVIATGKTVLAEERLETTDGITFWLVNKSPYFNEAHEVIGLIGISRDITTIKSAEKERKHLEDQLHQAQKMESIGQLAGGVAHDFNNMLGVILGHSEMAMYVVDRKQPLFADLEAIHSAATRSADITRQLLAFARKQTIAPRALDLNETIEGMLKMLRRLIGEDIDLVWKPGPCLWQVIVDPSQIDQMMVNLCVNARSAITTVGRLIVETVNITLDDEYCPARAGCIPGDYVQISVSDNGCGMEKETLEHIFEPFFTTKGVGEGTGLGLATVYGAVKQNKGFVNVHSELGQGTTFSVFLPRFVGTPSRMKPENVAKPSDGGHETILLVEDEPAILRMAMTMLEHLGYTVLAANTPREAIGLAGEHTREIHLLLTDVVMPEMNGLELAKNLRQTFPHLKCLFMSGYTSDVIAQRGILNKGILFIQKPFSIKNLATKVRTALIQG